MAEGAWGCTPAQRDPEGAPAQLAHGRHPGCLHRDESRSRCTGAFMQCFVQSLTLKEVEVVLSSLGFPTCFTGLYH